MRISDWSADVCSSDLRSLLARPPIFGAQSSVHCLIAWFAAIWQARRDLQAFGANVPRHPPGGGCLLLYFAPKASRPRRTRIAGLPESGLCLSLVGRRASRNAG